MFLAEENIIYTKRRAVNKKQGEKSPLAFNI